MTLLLISATVLAALSPRLAGLLEDHAALEVDELWRPLTGHLAHSSASHLILNLILFAPLAFLRERRRGAVAFLVEYLFLAAAVAAGVRLLHDGWESYRGLSGIVYGLLTLMLLTERRAAWARALQVLIAAKTVVETVAGGWILGDARLNETLGVLFLPASHLAGMIAAVALYIRSGHAMAARSSRQASAGSAASRSAPITATPRAPTSLTFAARSEVTPPSA